MLDCEPGPSRVMGSRVACNDGAFTLAGRGSGPPFLEDLNRNAMLRVCAEVYSRGRAKTSESLNRGAGLRLRRKVRVRRVRVRAVYPHTCACDVGSDGRWWWWATREGVQSRVVLAGEWNASCLLELSQKSWAQRNTSSRSRQTIRCGTTPALVVVKSRVEGRRSTVAVQRNLAVGSCSMGMNSWQG